MTVCAKQKLAEFISESGNMCCAGCATPDPKWVSVRFGAFICIKCSREHRSLGVHISKVLSVNLDELTHEALKQCPYAKKHSNSVLMPSISHAFRNSWKKKENEHKPPPKTSNSMIIHDLDHLATEVCSNYIDSLLRNQFWERILLLFIPSGRRYKTQNL
ncbi:unnamed protein product [Lactuca saligna]|uniref:Arf-GAP domain-containing protein n=1 Tax=Lactuca saligna TaxID=75948 RepID=A0AA36E2P9_LACSI|nr:unnamed protein product [Lactuca saligna]